jgi:protein-L-isoaspartate(D-aspartate) O-methyltransferase
MRRPTAEVGHGAKNIFAAVRTMTHAAWNARMPPIEDDIVPHLARFEAILDAGFRGFGVAEGLPAALRAAVAMTPRHRFVHRFRLGDGPLQDFDASPDAHLATVYSDQVMHHVDAAGARLPSTNSQPSYVLFLLHLLDLRPGQRVLEIGSGSGWLAAIMARLVGPSGSVSGVEILPDLAQQSRINLASVDLDRVKVLTQDGAIGDPGGAPFDRVMITAGTRDPPAMLFDQVAEGGRILMPLEERGGDGCQVTVLRRAGDRLVAERAVLGWFVPLLGTSQRREETRRSLDAVSFWPEIKDTPCLRTAWPLGMRSDNHGSPVRSLRTFLGRTEPDAFVLGPPRDAEPRSWMSLEASSEPFGIVDDATRSVALWQAGELVGYGGAAAARRLARAYARWAELGLPGMAAFDLDIIRATDASADMAHKWIDQRGDSALVWKLKPGLEDWRALLA